MLPKRLSRLPMCQPMEARLTHPQLPIQLVSFCFFFYFGSLVFVFLFVSPLPLISLLFSPFGYFNFYSLVLVGSLLWSLKKKERWVWLLGLFWGGYFIFFAFLSLFFILSFFSFPLPCSRFRWKNDVIRPCD